MQKLKITITMTVEYEPNPEHYDDGMTIEQMLSNDLAAYEDDIGIMLSDDRADISFSGQIVT